MGKGRLGCRAAGGAGPPLLLPAREVEGLVEPGPLAVRLDLTLGLDGSAAERMARWKALRFVEL